MSLLPAAVCLVAVLLSGACSPDGAGGSGGEEEASTRVYRLYFLGGQSNMEGFGFNASLPAELNRVQRGVVIFHGNPRPDGEPEDGRGVWAHLQPGHGTGFSSDGTGNGYSDRFGPELTFGARLAELDPEARIAILKYARGGSSIELGASGYGTWAPDFAEGNGVNQYDHFLAAVRNAFSARDVDGDGKPDHLVPAGIVWMQGEADAYHSETAALRYETNLRRLVDLMRAALRDDDLPVVIGQIADSGQDSDGKVMDFAEIVREAQARFVESDSDAAIVTSTSDYGFLADGWHYDNEGYLDLGAQFADAILRLEADR